MKQWNSAAAVWNTDKTGAPDLEVERAVDAILFCKSVAHTRQTNTQRVPPIQAGKKKKQHKSSLCSGVPTTCNTTPVHIPVPKMEASFSAYTPHTHISTWPLYCCN